MFGEKQEFLLATMLCLVFCLAIIGECLSADVVYVVDGQNVTLNCPSSVGDSIAWLRSYNGDLEEIYLHEVVLDRFKERFSISPPFNLKVLNLTMEDAGRYICSSNMGLGVSVVEYELVVLFSISCGSNVTEVIGTNSCQIPKTPASLKCQVSFRGAQEPSFTWIDLSTGNTSEFMNETLITRDLVGDVSSISSSLSLKMDMKSPALQCSVEQILNCMTPDVQVQYALQGDVHNIISTDKNDYLECKANSSVPCSHRWVAGDMVIGYGPYISRDALAASKEVREGALITCMATCPIAHQDCSFKVMDVSLQWSLKELFAAGDVAVVAVVLLLIIITIAIFIYARRRRSIGKKGRNPLKNIFSISGGHVVRRESLLRTVIEGKIGWEKISRKTKKEVAG